MAEPTAQVTEYTVSLLPEGPEASSYEITVAYRGHGLWAVVRRRRCLDANGEWDWEPLPSERDEQWLLRHRFDLETALRLAKEAAPNVVVNGRSAAEVAQNDCPCALRPAVAVCCSTHMRRLCHACYRRTHFVEVCAPDCTDCANEGLDPAKAVTR